VKRMGFSETVTDDDSGELSDKDDIVREDMIQKRKARMRIATKTSA